MTLAELHKELSFVDASRANRLKYANMVLNDMSLFPKLIEIVFMVEDKVSSRAAWVLEYVCIDYIYAIVPHLDKFTANLSKVRADSAVRPIAKICEHLIKTYYSKNEIALKHMVKPQHKDRIIEVCFDWLISHQKVAPKAYAMETLFLLGKEYTWVHPELAQVLEQNFPTQSAGFKARAKRILKKVRA